MNTKSLQLAKILIEAATIIEAVVVKRGDKWRIRKHDSNELLPQVFDTKEKADRALRAIMMHKRQKNK